MVVSTGILLGGAFLLTGCFNSLITQAIYNYVPINPDSMLLVFCAYIGYALRYFIPKGSKNNNKSDEERGESKKKTRDRDRERERERDREKERDKKKNNGEDKVAYIYMFLLVLAETVASQLSMKGFALVGSGLFQVLYSSIILFTAVMSVVLVNKRVTPFQWLALVILTVGLVISAGRVSANEVPLEGILYLFSATLICSITSTIAESLMKKYDIESSKYSMCYGFFGTGIVGLYMIAVSLNNWTEWVTGPIEKEGGSYIVVILLLCILIGGQLARGVVYFHCVAALGSVSTGVMYALQAVCMFSLSAIFFCNPQHPNQCFTLTKAFGTVVVSCGVALYSLGFKYDKVKT